MISSVGLGKGSTCVEVEQGASETGFVSGSSAIESPTWGATEDGGPAHGGGAASSVVLVSVDGTGSAFTQAVESETWEARLTQDLAAIALDMLD